MAGEVYDEDILDSVFATKITSTLGSATKVLYPKLGACFSRCEKGSCVSMPRPYGNLGSLFLRLLSLETILFSHSTIPFGLMHVHI